MTRPAEGTRAVDDALFHKADRLKKMLLPLIAVLLLAAALSLVGSAWSPRFIFVAVGMAALATVLVPLATAPDASHFVSSWSFVAVSVLVGVTLRSIFVAASRPDEAVIQLLYLRGQPVAFFLSAAALLLVALIVMAIGYSVLGVRFNGARERLIRYRVNPRALGILVGAFALIGFAAFARFVMETGGLDLVTPSAKRGNVAGLAGTDDLQTLGYLRFGAGMAAVAFYAQLSYWASQGLSLWPWRLPVLVGLFLNASLLPFYASSRSDLLWLLLAAGAILYHAGLRPRLPYLLLGMSLLPVLFFVVTFMRAEQTGDLAAVREAATPAALLDSTVANRNLADPFKTAHVMNNVGSVLEWKNGKSLYTWLVAPIPRELWAEKPAIAIGGELGVLVYGNRRAGVPPGLVGEMYWNLHLPGVLLGSLLFGIGLRYLHDNFAPRSSGHFALILIYCGAMIEVGVSLLGTAVGQAMFGMIADIATITVLLWFSSSRRGWWSYRSNSVARRAESRHGWMTSG